MTTVLLKDIRIRGGHGVEEAENSWGTHFRISISIEMKTDPPFQSISDTIDYAGVLELLRSVFSERTALIENLALNIHNAITEKYSNVASTEISIFKEDPPIRGLEGEVGIKFKKEVQS